MKPGQQSPTTVRPSSEIRLLTSGLTGSAAFVVGLARGATFSSTRSLDPTRVVQRKLVGAPARRDPECASEHPTHVAILPMRHARPPASPSAATARCRAHSRSSRTFSAMVTDSGRVRATSLRMASVVSGCSCEKHS